VSPPISSVVTFRFSPCCTPVRSQHSFELCHCIFVGTICHQLTPLIELSLQHHLLFLTSYIHLRIRLSLRFAYLKDLGLNWVYRVQLVSDTNGTGSFFSPPDFRI